MDIDDLRAICLALPATEEEVKWDTVLCFMVARKIFCLVGLDTPAPRPAFKTTEEVFEELIQSEAFVPASHLGHAKWVQLTDSSRVSRKELQHHIQQSYELVKAKLPKKVKAEWKLDA
jgi:predicted DNA-binding protein (MmcQ/YjbR family)